MKHIRYVFKNVLCLELRPDVMGNGWHDRCHRRDGHPGMHRVVYRDGYKIEWATGDRDTVRSRV